MINNSFKLVGVILIVFVALGMFIVGNKPKEKIIIAFPIDEDFSNTKEGSAVLDFKFPEKGFKVGDEFADQLVFLDSETIPGLKILYNQKERRIYAGIPPLVTGEITLLDGKPHKLHYTFNEKQQTISMDGILLASGEYTGSVTVLTGYVVHDSVEVIESEIPIKVSFE